MWYLGKGVGRFQQVLEDHLSRTRAFCSLWWWLLEPVCSAWDCSRELSQAFHPAWDALA